MNRIYALRRSRVTGSLVPVPEFAATHTAGMKRCRPVLKMLRLLLPPLLLSDSATGAVVSSETDYQIYRDFAENRGMFRPGATDIAIYSKQGELLGVLDRPMPDFSPVVAGSGVATLVEPGYLASVSHNRGYPGGSFGDGENSYRIVDRNNHPGQDFHLPRLNKLVTEVIPATVSEEGQKTDAWANRERYPVFYRLGSGTQYIKDRNGRVTRVAGGYTWLTGGTVGGPSSSGSIIASTPGHIFNPVNGPLASYSAAGDSGSPLFAYDTVLNEWVLAGVQSTWTGTGGVTNRWVAVPLDFYAEKLAEDNAPPVVSAPDGGVMEWTSDSESGTGKLTQGSTEWTTQGARGSDLNAGKNLIFSGQNGHVVLKNAVSQGAGSLTFRDDYTLSASGDSTWTGAGVIVEKGAEVSWQVNGVRGDNLHKLGEGTLRVQGTGVNESGLKVGDGRVVLDRRADTAGRVQAFSSVNIAGGRPVVVLADSRQVDPDTVSWGFRGGTLDVNGNSLTFHQLKAADYGAVLANYGTTPATVTLDWSRQAADVPLHSWSWSKRGNAGDLYRYNNPYTRTTDYFILKSGSYGYFPTNKASNSQWEFVGHNEAAAQKLVADRFNTAGYLFHGQLKGALNVEHRVPYGVTAPLILDGSADITGTFLQENGRLTLQGHPVIHASSSASFAATLASHGDTSVLTQPTSFGQPDQENRTFTFGRLLLKGTDFGLGRNATLNTDMTAVDSVVTLGDERVFIDRKDGRGTAFLPEEGRSDAVDVKDRSVFNGTVVLSGNSELNIRNAMFTGSITAEATGYPGPRVILSERSHWYMTGNAGADIFSSRGGTVSMTGGNWKPKTLTVNSMHAEGMQIGMGVNTADNTGDRIDILTQATGGQNTLTLSLMAGPDVALKHDLTMASAPAGTAHSYFSFADVHRGFTVFTPETQVHERDGRVLWQLKGTAPAVHEAGPVTAVAAELPPLPVESHHTPETPVETVPVLTPVTPPVTAPERVPETPAVTTPERVPETPPVTAPERVPETPSVTTPERVPETPPLTVPENAPDPRSPPVSTPESAPRNEVIPPAVTPDVVQPEVPPEVTLPEEREPREEAPSTEPESTTPETSTVRKQERRDGDEKENNNTPEAENHADAEGAGTNDAGDVERADESQAVTEEVAAAPVFREQENTALMKRVHAMFSARDVILADSADRWQQLPDEHSEGMWVMTGQGSGRYDRFSLKQNGVDMGFRHDGNEGVWWGLSAGLWRGESSADDVRNAFSLWNIRVLAGRQFASGVSVEGMAGYGVLSEDYTIQGELSDLSGRMKTHIQSAGVRAARKTHLSRDISITPSVTLNGVRVDGSSVQGSMRRVARHGGTSVWLKAGAEAGKKITDSLSVTAGLWHHSTLKQMPGMTLSDEWTSRHYGAGNTQRFTAQAGISGNVTGKLSLHAEVSGSTGDWYRTDVSGWLGISYRF